MIITLGTLLDGSPARIHLDAMESRAFRSATTYSQKLQTCRHAAIRASLVQFLMVGDRIVADLSTGRPGAAQRVVWLRPGEFRHELIWSDKGMNNSNTRAKT